VLANIKEEMMAVTAAAVQKLTEELTAIKDKLEEFKENKEKTLDNANSADYPNTARVETLEEQVQCLSDGLNDLETAISTLEDYI